MSFDTVQDSADVVMEDTDTAPIEEWLERRKTGVGGSDAAAAVGLSPWDSPYSLWEMKQGNLPGKEDTEPMKWGRRLERAIGEGFAEDTGIPVTRFPYMLRSKQWPWALVNLDFLTEDLDAVVECKNVGLRQLDEWEEGNVPGHIKIQGLHELAVTGLDHLWFAALVGGQNPRYIKIERNDAAIKNLMESERVFWEMVKANTPPVVDGSEATTQALKLRYADPDPGSMVEVDVTTMAELCQTRAGLKADAKYTKARLDAVENEIKATLAEHEIGTVNGVPAITWKQIHKEPYTVKAQDYRTIHIPKGSVFA